MSEPAFGLWTQIQFALRTVGLPLLLRGARYSVEKAYAELKYADPLQPPRGGLSTWWQALKNSLQPPPQPPSFNTFNTPGPVQSWRQQDNTLTLTCQAAHIQLTVVSPRIIQVRLSPQHDTFPKPFSYAVVKPAAAWPLPDVAVTEENDVILLKTSILTVQIHRRNSLIDFLDATGQPIDLDSSGLGWQDGWVSTERTLPPYAPVLGLGEHAVPINLRGRAYTIWATDPGGHYRSGNAPLYQAHPWFISLNQNRAFGMFWDNTFWSHFDLGHSQANHYTLTAHGGELRYYFIFGPEIRTVLMQFAELTGKMPLPPLWALGLHQSRWSYKSEREVRELARQFRERQIPCDAIHLDIHYMQDYKVFTWHKRRFPNPAEMIKDLRPQGFKIVSIIDPGIKADRFNAVAEAGLRDDVFVKFADGKVFKGPVWPGDCYFPDFTNPAVRIWWGSQFRSLVDDGIAGFWTDMNEPAVFGYNNGTLPKTVQHYLEGQYATHAQVHNVYGLQMARATQNAISVLRPQRRPFVLSRSGYSGIQRYAAVWTADNESTWEHLALSLSMILQLGLSGVPFAGVDIGGFYGAPTPELFARWVQLGAFFPLFRIHSADATPRQEPWSFGPQVEAIVKQAVELRYRLLPYFYTVFWQASQTGLPIVRPMLLDFQHDMHTHSLDDQFMVGESLLVAPILARGVTQRRVYLPNTCNWVNYHTGNFLTGGQTISVNAPLEHTPIFVKSGTVLPHWPLLQHTEQASTLSTIHLHVYVGNGQSLLYEDDGKGKHYLNGHFKQTLFVSRSDSDRLVIITHQQGEYAPPYDTLTWHIHFSQPFEPSVILADNTPVETWQPDDWPNSIIFRTPILQRLELWR